MQGQKNDTTVTKIILRQRNGDTGIRKKTWRRAEIIVEASYIVPWTVILLALLITMTFYVHNRVWYTAAACEASLSGNRYEEGSGGTGSAGYTDTYGGDNAAGSRYAEATMQQRIREQAMPGSEPEKQISCTQEATEVKLSGQKFPAFQEYFSWTVEEKVRKVRPARIVRGRWLLTSVIQSIGNSEP